MTTASAPLGPSRRAISPREGVSMTPPHQVPAALPLNPRGWTRLHRKLSTPRSTRTSTLPCRCELARRRDQSLATLTRSANPADIARQQVLIVFQPSVHQANLPPKNTCRRTTCRRAGRSTKTSWFLRSRRAAWALRSLYTARSVFTTTFETGWPAGEPPRRAPLVRTTCMCRPLLPLTVLTPFHIVRT